MRWSETGTEAWRNLTTGTTRAIGLAIVLVVLAFMTVGMDALVIRSVYVGQRGLVDGGGATVRVSAKGAIDAVQCLALGEVDGVRAAIALRSVSQRFRLETLPASPPSLYEVAGDATALFGGTPPDGDGVLVSSQLAEQLHAEAGDVLPVADHADGARVRGVFQYPEDGRASVLSAAILQPVPASAGFDECWATVWPFDAATEGLITTAVALGTPTSEVTISRLNQTFGVPRATGDALASRTTLFAPLAGGILAAAWGFFAVRVRRVELALARHLGQSRRAQSVQQALEALAWTVPSLALCFTVTVVVATRDLTAAEAAAVTASALIDYTSMASAVLSGALIAILAISARRIHQWSRDR
ncbi:hypothetical protein [Microbacterium sp.]|uniref:hypothetical protein n=1 Tax=Microbacterium sp. TaxID=51671 RepID=UPI0039E543D7